MRFKLTKERKVTLLRWLQSGYINTDEMPELNSKENNAFLQLMQELDERESEADAGGVLHSSASDGSTN